MRRIALAALLLTTAVAVGCSADEAGDAGSAGAANDHAGAQREDARSSDVTNAATLGRQQIRTAAVSVEVPDVTAAARTAVRAAESAGGFLESEQTAGPKTTLTLRVPPEKFTETSEALAALGTVTARTVETRDVTGDVADVAGRLKAARASTDRVRGLLAQARGIDEITSIEAELNDREAALESLESRRRALTGQTSYAAITATFTSGAAPAGDSAGPEATGFLGGLQAGWRVFQGTASVLLVILGAVLPFLPLLLFAAWVARRKVSARA